MRVVAHAKIEPIQNLRGLAVLLTVLAHLPLATAPWQWAGFPAPYWIGVVLFYGVSGYIIFLTTEKKGWDDLSSFYVRRLMRIGPVLCLSCSIAMLMALAVPHGVALVDQFFPPIDSMSRNVASQLLLIGNFAPYLGMTIPLSILGLWSISVEGQFYFTFGWFLQLKSAARAKALVVAAVAVFATKLVFFPAIAASHMFYYEVLLVSAAACSIRERVRPNKVAIAACLVYALLFPLLPKRIEIFLPTYPVLALAVAYIAVCAGHGFRFLSRTSVTSTALHWMGERSYVIYVLHFQVLAFAGLAMQMGGLNFRSATAFAVGLTVAVLAAIPLYEFVHKTVEASGIRIGRELSGSLQSLSAGYEAKRWPLGKDPVVPHGKG